MLACAFLQTLTDRFVTTPASSIDTRRGESQLRPSGVALAPRTRSGGHTPRLNRFSGWKHNYGTAKIKTRTRRTTLISKVRRLGIHRGRRRDLNSRVFLRLGLMLLLAPATLNFICSRIRLATLFDENVGQAELAG